MDDRAVEAFAEDASRDDAFAEDTSRDDSFAVEAFAEDAFAEDALRDDGFADAFTADPLTVCEARLEGAALPGLEALLPLPPSSDWSRSSISLMRSTPWSSINFTMPTSN